MEPRRAEKCKLAQHFTEDEFACRCCGMVIVHPRLVEKLETLRQLVGAPVIVNSGYRCPAHNKAVGGVSNSYHVRGMAADIQTPGLSAGKLAQKAEQVGFDDGVGIYRQQGFIHVDVDVRGYRARWDG